LQSCGMGNVWNVPLEEQLTKNLMNDWREVVQLASTINFSDEEEWMIWRFTSNGVYSS
jgi:hypothetical protein